MACFPLTGEHWVQAFLQQKTNKIFINIQSCGQRAELLYRQYGFWQRNCLSVNIWFCLFSLRNVHRKVKLFQLRCKEKSEYNDPSSLETRLFLHYLLYNI